MLLKSPWARQVPRCACTAGLGAEVTQACLAVGSWVLKSKLEVCSVKGLGREGK